MSNQVQMHLAIFSKLTLLFFLPLLRSVFSSRRGESRLRVFPRRPFLRSSFPPFFRARTVHLHFRRYGLLLPPPSRGAWMLVSISFVLPLTRLFSPPRSSPSSIPRYCLADLPHLSLLFAALRDCHSTDVSSSTFSRSVPHPLLSIPLFVQLEADLPSLPPLLPSLSPSFLEPTRVLTYQ